MDKSLTRTICCKLDVDGHDAALAATQRAFNEAATWIGRVCWEEGIANTNTAHHRVYGETRLAYGLGAQLAVCARAKAVEAIKAVKAKHRETCPQFGPRGNVRYDARTYRLMSLDRVSLNTLEGRVVCQLLLGARQHQMLADPAWEIGGAGLVWRSGIYYLHVTQSREAPPEAEPASGVVGVDLGTVNLATDSEGEHFTGAMIHVVRNRYRLRRQRLQKCGTRNAKRRIRRMGRREARFQSAHITDWNLAGKTNRVAGSKREIEMSSAPYWTPAEDALLRERYPTASNAELQALLPARPMAGIRQRAHQIGVRKNLDAYEGGMSFESSVIGHLAEAEKGYLAGIIDGEGCIMLARHLGKRGKHVYHVYVSIANTSMALHRWLQHRLPGAGYLRQRRRVKVDARPTSNQRQWRTGYDWIISGNRVATVLLREIAPYLVIKRAQAEMLAGGYLHLSEAERDALYLHLRQLKREP